PKRELKLSFIFRCQIALENVIRQSPRDRHARLLLADTLNGLGKYRQADQHYTALLGNVQEKSFRPPVD
ncbi:MAG: hypothetical protein COB96_01855, partial [Planctomycetota bacterium]